MQKVKTEISKKLKKGLHLSIRPSRMIRLEVTHESLIIHTKLLPHYVMAEAYIIYKILDNHIRVKEREYGNQEPGYILALSANTFVGGSYLEALTENAWQKLMKTHAKRGTNEKRICQFTNKFSGHLPAGEFLANGVYQLCAQLIYNLLLWIRNLMVPKPNRKKRIKRIRRCVRLTASRIITNRCQI